MRIGCSGNGPSSISTVPLPPGKAICLLRDSALYVKRRYFLAPFYQIERMVYSRYHDYGYLDSMKYFALLICRAK